MARSSHGKTVEPDRGMRAGAHRPLTRRRAKSSGGGERWPLRGRTNVLGRGGAIRRGAASHGRGRAHGALGDQQRDRRDGHDRHRCGAAQADARAPGVVGSRKRGRAVIAAGVMRRRAVRRVVMNVRGAVHGARVQHRRLAERDGEPHSEHDREGADPWGVPHAARTISRVVEIASGLRSPLGACTTGDDECAARRDAGTSTRPPARAVARRETRRYPSSAMSVRRRAAPVGLLSRRRCRQQPSFAAFRSPRRSLSFSPGPHARLPSRTRRSVPCRRCRG